MTIDTSLMKRKPDGTIDVAAELREVAGYLRVACPEQKTIIAHLTFLAQRKAATDIANANLIAAAPDLYNALSTLADAWERKSLPCDAARAALAKARGES